MKKFLIALSCMGVLFLTACNSSTLNSYDDETGDNTSSSMHEESMEKSSHGESMEKSSVMKQASSAAQSSAAMMSSEKPAAAKPSVRVVEISMSDWEFSQSVLNVKKGEKVVIRLKDIDGVHSFMSNDLGINVALKEGETKEFPLPTDKTGTFMFRCGIPCGPGHKDMKGTITVS
jgi:cytochrome c oxidase subunit II